MEITLKQADAIFSILVADTKHRDGKPFKSEIYEFFENDKEEYYFLSDDYYTHWISGDGSKESPLRIRVDSVNPKILERTNIANMKIHQIFNS